MSSRSFMDAIRSVALKGSLTEGANEKTSDGMTKDAKRFVQDLHKVNDPGVKHLVQKDSEAKDYEKMFKPDIEKFPTRLADMEPSQSVDKYIEYNNRPVQEAKKLSKKDDEKTGDNPDNEDATGPITNEEKHKKDCECKDCKTVSEIYVNPNNNTPAAAALRKAQSGPNASTLPNQAGQGPASPMRGQGSSGKVPAFKAPQAAAPINKTRAQAAAPSGTPTWGTQKKPSATGQTVQSVARDVRSQPGQGLKTVTSTSQIKPSGMSGNYSNKGGSATNMAQATQAAGKMAVDRNKAQNSAADMAKSQTSKMGGGSVNKAPGTGVKVVPTSAPPPKAAAAEPAEAKPAAKPQVQKPAAQAAKPKPTGNRLQNINKAEKAVGPQARQALAKTSLGVTTTQKAAPRKAPAGTNTLKQSYEIEWNGNSYVMNEAQIQALDAFIEKYGIMEGTAGEFIHKEMQHPEKLTAKGKKQKIKQSLAIYYSKKRRGENP